MKFREAPKKDGGIILEAKKKIGGDSRVSSSRILMKFPTTMEEVSEEEAPEEEDDLVLSKLKNVKKRRQQGRVLRKRKGKQVAKDLPKKGKKVETTSTVRDPVQVPYEKTRKKTDGSEFLTCGTKHVLVDKDLQTKMEGVSMQEAPGRISEKER